MYVIAIIPARMGSSRFPGKPMESICGIPMIGHVYLRCKQSEILNDVYVATCDQVIYDYIERLGGKALMTSDRHERCGDRVAEAMQIVEAEQGRRIDIVVLVQGDEPLIHPEMIAQATEPLIRDEMVQISNLMGKMTEVEWHDVNEVKVVTDLNGDAIYFSRGSIPAGLNYGGSIPMRKQICVIPHRRDFLLEFAAMEQTPLEKIESVDMLRIIEHGLKVRMVPTEHAVYSVDTPEDLRKVEAIMREDSVFASYRDRILP